MFVVVSVFLVVYVEEVEFRTYKCIETSACEKLIWSENHYICQKQGGSIPKIKRKKKKLKKKQKKQRAQNAHCACENVGTAKKNTPKNRISFLENIILQKKNNQIASNQIRTDDLLITSETLYQLSHGSQFLKC